MKAETSNQFSGVTRYLFSETHIWKISLSERRIRRVMRTYHNADTFKTRIVTDIAKMDQSSHEEISMHLRKFAGDPQH